jgi:hypothetical protein
MIKFILGCIVGAVLATIGITGVTHYVKVGADSIDVKTNQVQTFVKKHE